ncbi:MAG: [Fe-Fe] hydrogenase large subunit C-terminal domain-containing protein [Rikenellaceae bacterium]
MFSEVWPISILENSCEDCFRCVRECNVKAIKSDKSQMVIDEQKCIACGHCVETCPMDLITPDSHILKVKHAIKNSSVIVASIAPNWIAEFAHVEPHRMIEALRLVGFTHVSESSIGASLVKRDCAEKMFSSSKMVISNTCPSITKLIKTSYPELSEHIVESVHPTIAHARFLKHHYGKDCVVVAIDSCTSTKMLVREHPDELFASLTFDQLRELLDEESINFDLLPGNQTYQFEPYKSDDDNLYVVPRGVYNNGFLAEFNLVNSTIYNYAGLKRVKTILDSLNVEQKPQNTYVELFACEDGCLYGPGNIDSINLITKRIMMSSYEKGEINGHTKRGASPVAISHKHTPTPIHTVVGEDQITKSLEMLYMHSGDELPNCGSCGYISCRSFAKALSLGRTREDMCVYYQKKLAQNKFTLLLRKLYSAVAVVDENLKIVEANNNFTELLDLSVGSHLNSKITPLGGDFSPESSFDNYIANVLSSSETVIEKDVQLNDKIIKLLIFPLQKGKMACIIARNLFENNVSGNEIIARTQNVINDNLETVQKIAYLLGENASRTEAILNSIIESQKALNER